MTPGSTVTSSRLGDANDAGHAGEIDADAAMGCIDVAFERRACTEGNERQPMRAGDGDDGLHLADGLGKDDDVRRLMLKAGQCACVLGGVAAWVVQRPGQMRSRSVTAWSIARMIVAVGCSEIIVIFYRSRLRRENTHGRMQKPNRDRGPTGSADMVNSARSRTFVRTKPPVLCFENSITLYRIGRDRRRALPSAGHGFQIKTAEMPGPTRRSGEGEDFMFRRSFWLDCLAGGRSISVAQAQDLVGIANETSTRAKMVRRRST